LILLLNFKSEKRALIRQDFFLKNTVGNIKLFSLI